LCRYDKACSGITWLATKAVTLRDVRPRASLGDQRTKNRLLPVCINQVVRPMEYGCHCLPVAFTTVISDSALYSSLQSAPRYAAYCHLRSISRRCSIGSRAEKIVPSTAWAVC